MIFPCRFFHTDGQPARTQRSANIRFLHVASATIYKNLIFACGYISQPHAKRKNHDFFFKKQKIHRNPNPRILSSSPPPPPSSSSSRCCRCRLRRPVAAAVIVVLLPIIVADGSIREGPPPDPGKRGLPPSLMPSPVATLTRLPLPSHSSAAAVGVHARHPRPPLLLPEPSPSAATLACHRHRCR